MSQDKFISSEQPPEGLKRELLVILNEECVEVAHRVCKALRFGMFEVEPGQPHTNEQRIADELGDLFAVIDALTGMGYLNACRAEAASQRKHTKLEQYLQSTNTGGDHE